jgi:hypothetical protein
MATDEAGGRHHRKFPPRLGRLIILGTIAATSLLTPGCANSVASTDTNPTPPDPEWYQTNNNPFHAD